MENDAVKLDIQGTIASAVEDAMARASAVFNGKPYTLVDSISKKDWEAWDASDEQPNVIDTDIDSLDDEIDAEFCEPTAA